MASSGGLRFKIRWASTTSRPCTARLSTAATGMNSNGSSRPTRTLRVLGGVSRGQEALGRDSVLDWLAAKWPGAPACLHLSGNLRFTPDGDGAKGTCDFLFLIKNEDGSLHMSSAGRYLDRYARHDGRWVIAERLITFIGEPI